MDFSQAISAHTEWKARLLKYIENPDNSLKADLIANDKLCQLGQWIESQSKIYERLPEYQRLVCDHAKFHKHAAQIVDKANQGQYVTENDITHPECAYTIASRNVVRAITDIRRKITNCNAEDIYLEAKENSLNKENEAAQQFLYRLAEASPGVLQLIERTATDETMEIAKLINAYNDKYALSPAMINIMRESIRNACTEMMMGLADICKKSGR